MSKRILAKMKRLSPKLIIFDLDNTLVNSVQMNAFLPCENEVLYSEGQIIFEIDKNICWTTMRPHAQNFLQKLVEMGFHLAIFSLGEKRYVNTIVKHLFWNIPWKFIWTRDNSTGNVKILSDVVKLFPEYKRDDILLIDDQYMNCYENATLGFKCLNVPIFNQIGKRDTIFYDNITMRKLYDLITGNNQIAIL